MTQVKAVAGRDVVVDKDHPLTITDNDRTFGKVTIMPGGQVTVQTAADVRIDTLIRAT